MRISLLAIVGLCLATPSARVAAGVCTVPGTHDSIQAAENDPGCNDIQIFNQTYFELIEIDRDLNLSGPAGGSAEINGRLDVSGTGTMAALEEFGIATSCADGGLRVSGGAQVTGTRLRVTFNPRASCLAGLIFRQGFEE